jgi:hypothetical protein
MKLEAIAIPTVMLLGCATTPPPSPQLAGTWRSPQGEVRPAANGGKLFLTREFRITPDTSTAHFEFFEDDTFAVKTMTFDFGGHYEVLGPSGKVAGATAANFPIEHLTITPWTAGVVGWLDSAAPGTCGSNWQIGVPQDLAATHGCTLVGIRVGDTVEHDIFKVTGDELRFGARPADGSLLDTEAKRPTAFQVPVVRQ